MYLASWLITVTTIDRFHCTVWSLASWLVTVTTIDRFHCAHDMLQDAPVMSTVRWCVGEVMVAKAIYKSNDYKLCCSYLSQNSVATLLVSVHRKIALESINFS